MSDIVERLRKWSIFGYGYEASCDMKEAATEIEHQRTVVANAAQALSEQTQILTALRAENEKLRAALEPFARLYLWPFDNHLAKEIMADDDWCEEENDATEEEVFIRRKYIRIARAVFLGDNHE